MSELFLQKPRPLALAIFAALNLLPAAQAACISLTALGSAYTQDFNGLATSGTANTLALTGWALAESGTSARNNGQYAADTGSGTSGDVISFGASGVAERAFGTLRSGTLAPTIGACFTNNTGAALSGLNIAYTGEEWRLGTANRTDQLTFEYSTSATDLATGTWTGVAALNFITPDTATAGAKVGNNAGERTALSATVGSLNIANGATFWLRWTDVDASGADDGLAVDDFSLTPTGSAGLPTLSIDDVSQSEGNSGNTAFTFTVSLSAPAPVGGVSFDIATADGTATAGSDYVANALTSQTIAAGSSAYTFTVQVKGDGTYEPNEGFTVNLSNASNATIADAQGAGTITNDDSACGLAATKISAVQGSGAATPLSGSVSVEGIVVGDYQGTSANSLRGFFVQEEDADSDGNAATSEGVFVFDGTTALANVSVGDKVRVTGTPVEFFNMTQLGTVTGVEVCASNQALPTAAALTLPVPNVPANDLTAATAAVNSYYEAFEGMLVTFPTTLKVSEYFELERYGQLVLSQGGRIPTYTNVSVPSTAGYTNHLINLAKRQIILDDKDNTQNSALTNNQALPYPTGGLSTTNRFRGGDSIANLTGVLHWSFAGFTGTDAWRIRPVSERYSYTFAATNPRKAVPTVGGTLKVSSFNVLNYFTTIDTTASDTTGPCAPSGTQDCRGADSASELSRQTAKAATALCGINADIFGLMELENNATASLTSLVTAANAISGCGPFAYINTGTIGTDAIKVGLLYNTNTVAPSGSFALLTSSADARFIDTKNRPSLAQTFSQTSTGEKLTVVVNHLKSKGSACTDINPSDIDNNDGQGNCNLTRTAAAQALVDWVQGDPTGSFDPDFLLIGDMNSYAKEHPIQAIEKGADDTANTSDDFTNLVKTFGGTAAYSYVFDGQTGYIDHALASPSLLAQVTGAGDWHINADEPPSFDYNDTVADTGEATFEVKPSALPLYAVNPYRTSDHDPVVIGIQLAASINRIDGTAARDTLTGTPGKDRMTGLGSADLLTGGMGKDVFVYLSPTDGIDTITDFTLGEDTLDLTALLLSIGYEGGNALGDGVVKLAATGADTLVSVDPDGSAGSAPARVLVRVQGVSVLNLNNAANFKF